MSTVAVQRNVEQAGGGARRLLGLEESLDLDQKAANRLYADHLNKYMLQIFGVLGLGDLDIASAQGMEIRLRDGRTLLDFSVGLGAASIGHNHPRILAAERLCHDRLWIDCIKLAPNRLRAPSPTTSPSSCRRRWRSPSSPCPARRPTRRR